VPFALGAAIAAWHGHDRRAALRARPLVVTAFQLMTHYANDYSITTPIART
jgi:hypothetical protein